MGKQIQNWVYNAQSSTEVKKKKGVSSSQCDQNITRNREGQAPTIQQNMSIERSNKWKAATSEIKTIYQPNSKTQIPNDEFSSKPERPTKPRKSCIISKITWILKDQRKQNLQLQ